MTKELNAGAFLQDLERRGLLHQATDRQALETHLKESRSVYAGFDATKDSLTIGNLVSIMMLRRFQKAGHEPVVLMGGGTGLIGDPSGKDAERQLLTREGVQKNVEGQARIFAQILGKGEKDDLSAETPFVQRPSRTVNNQDWIEGISYIDALRDIGKHFSVNMMMQKDSVKSRLESRERGISYTEFSYMILQAYDFSHLADNSAVTVQIGGSDQWGNIVAGVDLTRRRFNQTVFGLTTPLLTKSDGGKFGKTEDGAIWLTADRTSAYAFYQFWLNASDEDVATFLKFFSEESMDEIESLIERHQENPGAREAQKHLAKEMTELLHGRPKMEEAQRASVALFTGDVGDLSAELIDDVFGAAPKTELSRAAIEGSGIPLVELLIEAGAAKSKREARQFISSGAVSLNGEKVKEEVDIQADKLLHDEYLLLRRGKKNWYVLKVEASQS
ncbi:MAG: tyrosine--tRNA ligase [Polyangiaceae bacterium]|nr:tyrosine--tRNA ligase [Polyangiaceae bacterium]